MLPGKEARDGIVTGLYAGCLAPVFVTGSYAGCLALVFVTGSFAGCLASVFVASLIPDTWEIAVRTSGNKYPKCLVEPVLVLQQGKYFYDMFLAFTFKVKTSRALLTLCCVVIVFVNHVINHFINLYWGLLIWSLHVHLGATTGAVIWVIIWYKEKWIKICISWSLQVKQQDIFLPWCASFWASLLHDVPVQVPPCLAPLWWDVLAPVNGRLNVNGVRRSLGWAAWMAVLECWPEITKRSF